MLQKVPTATPTEIKHGTGRVGRQEPDERFDRGQPGMLKADYGLINAVKAINAINVLQVVITDPANGATVTLTPGAITVTFNKPVRSSRRSAAATFSSPPRQPA